MMTKYTISYLAILLLVVALGIGAQSCKKEVIDTQKIVERDTVTLYVHDTITTQHFIPDSITTFILVRHAEKNNGGSDPDLSAAGRARALKLSAVLGQVDVTTIYSTNYRRTLQTAQPTADKKFLSIERYNPSNLSALINQVLQMHQTETVLVVGHSNTTPDLLNKLIGKKKYGNIPENEYNNLYIVNVAKKGQARVIHLKYGD